MTQPIMTIGFLDTVSPEQLVAYRLENQAFLQPFSPRYAEDFFTLTGQKKWLAEVNEAKYHGVGYTFGIFLLREANPLDEILIGLITICPILRGSFQNAWIGYELAEKWNGRGYMTTALEMVCAFAFNTLKLHRLELAIVPNNQPSIRVAEKNHFRKIGLSKSYADVAGVWCEHLLYEKINESW